MSMNIGSLDPRMIKQLQPLQASDKTSRLPADTESADAAGGRDFSELLQGLMATQAAVQNMSARSQSSPAAANHTAALSKAPLFASSAYGAWEGYLQEQPGAGQATAYEELIQEASRKYGVPSSMVKAVIEAESSFNPRAVSQAGAKGLMQLMDSTGSGLGVTNPFDPAQNIEGGTRYLSDLLMKYNGNQGVALAAYNAGPGRLDRLGIRTDQQLTDKLHLLPKETQHYVRKVQQLQSGFELY